MTTDLREEDIAVLQAIQDGASTVTEICEATTLTTRQINYCINEKSLEELGLVEVQRPEGREWREINGQEAKVWKPKTLELTDQGIRELEVVEKENRYQEMSREELIHTVQDLEERMDRLERVFKDFRGKVMEQISK